MVTGLRGRADMYPPHHGMFWTTAVTQQCALCSHTCPVNWPLFLPPFPPSLALPTVVCIFIDHFFFFPFSFFAELLRMAKDCIARRKCLSTGSQTYLGWVVSLNGAMWLRGAKSLAAASLKGLRLCVFCSSFVFRHWMWVFPRLLLMPL